MNLSSRRPLDANDAVPTPIASSGSRAGSFARIGIVAPVFNDWESASEVVARLAALTNDLPSTAVILVNDGSTAPVELPSDSWPAGLESVTVLNSAVNMGHQRAIALGLVEVASRADVDAVVVMDADGEDEPADIPLLLAALSREQNPRVSVAVAQRGQRTEALSFRLLYRAYKVVFRWSTGRRLDFGNFSALSAAAVSQLVRMPELWNHFPAAVMRSRLEVAKIPVDRGHRIHGESRMNLVSLVNHGLAAIATFSDVVFVRLMIAVSVASGVLVAAGLAVAAIRVWSTLAVPGWATAAMGFILLALFQFLTLLGVMTFIQLAARSQIPTTPIQAAPQYIRSIERIYP